MGLYLGMSFMSIGEVLLLILGVCKIFLGRSCSPQQGSQMHPSRSDPRHVESTRDKTSSDQQQTIHKCMAVTAIISLQILIGLAIFLIVQIERKIITINV